MDSTKTNVEITSIVDKTKDVEQDAIKNTTIELQETERDSSPFNYRAIVEFDPLTNEKKCMKSLMPLLLSIKA